MVVEPEHLALEAQVVDRTDELLSRGSKLGEVVNGPVDSPLGQFHPFTKSPEQRGPLAIQLSLDGFEVFLGPVLVTHEPSPHRARSNASRSSGVAATTGPRRAAWSSTQRSRPSTSAATPPASVRISTDAR